MERLYHTVKQIRYMASLRKDFDSYQSWVRCGIWLKDVGRRYFFVFDETMFKVWDNWSRQSDKYDFEVQVQKWESF